jgi:hypothetical protein
MSGQAGLPYVLKVRAFLVIAALICLCVSSNVGPQFFPLPPATTQDVQLKEANQAWQAPPADARSFRVPIMAQSKKRADQEPSQSDQLIVLLTDRFSFPSPTLSSFEISCSAGFTTSVTMAPAAGRAPPLSV